MPAERSAEDRLLASSLGSIPTVPLSLFSQLAVNRELAKKPDAAWKRVFADELDKIGIKRKKSLDMPAFDPVKKTIIGITDSPEIMAHELGHAKNFNDVERAFGKTGKNIHTGLYSGSKRLTLLGGIATPLASLLGADDDTVKTIGVAGSASSTPVLLEELIASVRGAKALGKAGKGMGSKLKAFIGIPSYIAAGIAPLAPWLGYKMLDSTKEKDIAK